MPEARRNSTVPDARSAAPDEPAAPDGPGSPEVGSGLLCELDEDGERRGQPVPADDLVAAIAERELAGHVRWVWQAAVGLYPALARAGARVARCHDVALAEALLRARDGADPAADDASAQQPRLRPAGQPTLFEPDLFEPTQPGPRREPSQMLDALIQAHADQLRRIAADPDPVRFALLVAAESAGALASAEMSLTGLPWRSDVHDALLTEQLGPRPAGAAARPPKLAELARQISAAFGAGGDGGPGPHRARAATPVNPDSPAQLLKAFAADGIRLSSTRLAVLRDVDHPAVAPLLEYKELARLHSAFGWSWLDAWVSGGRFRPEYVVGGVVSGRWASRGGGALQIPRLLRRAVVAEPGWVLVVADAAQLEPRVLAALAGDRAFATAAAAGDLYAELAGAFGGDRAKAKVALLSAMYGGAGGEAGQLLAVLRRRFPAAAGYVEAAARAGEEGRVVRSVLGRTCPPPTAAWRALTADAVGPATRARGRFTRNFVVQASAADWALVMLVSLRARLWQIKSQNGPSELVFFQHDEVVVHCPAEAAGAVSAALTVAAEEATRLVFGPTQVAFPLNVAVVGCYADAK